MIVRGLRCRRAMLWVEGNRALRHRAEPMNFVEGTSWREADAGANAPGTAPALHREVQIVRAELSRLRQPVSPYRISTRPYRLEFEPDCDLGRRRAALGSHDHRRAVELYRGPLLPGPTCRRSSTCASSCTRALAGCCWVPATPDPTPLRRHRLQPPARAPADPPLTRIATERAEPPATEPSLRTGSSFLSGCSLPATPARLPSPGYASGPTQEPRMAVCAQPGAEGGVVSYQSRYDNWINNGWVPPTDGTYSRTRHR